MELITGIKTRRTVRKFTDKPVSKETINEIIGAAAYAPSWKNSQTTRWSIAAQTFCLAAHDMGIGCVIMGIVDGDKLSEILSLPDTERVAAVIALGYPAEEPDCPHKKSAEEISRYF